MARVLLICLLVTAVGYGNIGFSQRVPYKKFSTQEGLANADVYRICQDRFGYLWLSTNYGLSRFDGYNFINYSSYASSGAVLSIATADSGVFATTIKNQLLYVSNTGEQRIYTGTEKIVPTIIAMKIDKNGLKWLLNKNHEVYVLKGSQLLKVNPRSANGMPVNVYDLQLLDDDELIMASDSGIFKTGKDNIVSDFSPKIPHVAFYSIAKDRNGYLYFGGNGTICIYKDDAHTRMIPVANAQKILNLCADDTGHVWFTGSMQGLFLFANGQVVDFSKFIGLENVFVNDMYCDKNGTLFLGTYGKGLYIVKHTNITYYDEKSGLSNNNVYNIAPDNNGNIFCGAFGKISLCAKETCSILEDIPIGKDEEINDLLVVNQNLWVTTPYFTYKYNLATRKYIKYHPGFLSMYLDEHNDILLGGYDQVQHLKQEQGYIDSIPPVFPFLKGRVRSLFYSPQDGYWFGTREATYQYKDNVLMRYDSNNSGLQRQAFSIGRDDHGTLWFATVTGLVSYSTKKEWKRYTVKDGLPADLCFTLFIKHNKVWVGTMRGLVCYDGLGFKQFGAETGLPQEEINAIYEDSNSLWMGTSDGLCHWGFEAEGRVQKISGVIFNTIRSQNKILPLSDTIVLPYKQNALQVEYVAIEYNRQQSMVYEYRVNGEDGAWYETQSRSLPLTSLAPGTYRLEVRSRYRNTAVVSAPSVLTIVVLAPYWQKAWFLFASLVVLAALIVMLVQWRIKRIKRIEKLKFQRYTRLVQLKQQATNALINPHFIFNSLNSIQHFVNQADIRTVNKFITKFAKLIRVTMENSTKLNIKLGEEIKMLELYLSLEKMRLDGKLSYEINIDEQLNTDTTMIPSMLLQPYVENAVWHGIVPKELNGFVKVSIKKGERPYLLITIEDDGVGIKNKPADNESSDHNSWGMNINKQRLEIIEKLTGYAVFIGVQPSSVGVGTIVSIKLPVK